MKLFKNLEKYTNIEKIYFLSFGLYIFLPITSILLKILFPVPIEYLLLDLVFIIQVTLVVFIVGRLCNKKGIYHVAEKYISFCLIILALWWGLAALQIGQNPSGSTPLFWNITLFFPDLFEVLTIRASLLYAILLGIAIIQITAVFVYKPKDRVVSKSEPHRNEPSTTIFALGVVSLIIVTSSLTINLIIGSSIFYIRAHLIYLIGSFIVAIFLNIGFIFTIGWKNKFAYIKWTGNVFFFSGFVLGYTFLFMTELSFWFFRFTYLLITLIGLVVLFYKIVRKIIKQRDENIRT